MGNLENFSDKIVKFIIILLISYFLLLILHGSSLYTLLIIPAAFITIKSPISGILLALFFLLSKQKFTYISFFNTVIITSIGAFLTVSIAYIICRFIFYKKQEKFLYILSAPFFIPSISIISVIHIMAIRICHGKIPFANQTVIIILMCICFIPNALYIILNGLKSININYFKTAVNLNLSQTKIFKIIEYPFIKNCLFKSFILVFMLSINSFNIFFLNTSSHDIYTKIYNSIIIANEDLYDIVAIFHLINFCLVSFFYKIQINEYTYKDPSSKKIIENLFSAKTMPFHGGITFFISIFIFIILLKTFFIQNFDIDLKILGSFLTSCLLFGCTLIISFIFLFCLLHAKANTQKILQKLTLITSPFLLSILISEYTFLSGNFIKILIISLIISLSKLPFIFLLVEKNFNSNVRPYINLTKNLGISIWTYITKILIPSLKIKQCTGFILFICINELSAVILIGNGSIETLSSTIASYMYYYEFSKLETTNLLVVLVALSVVFFANKNKKF